jgi:photosystem II stability/assembly factor-like uncharacterized protein
MPKKNEMHVAPLAAVITIAALSTVRASADTAPALPTDDPAFHGLAWRNVGPFRGGRVEAVAGVAQDQRVYYMGSTGGGVWKTTDAGTTWNNISDGYFTSGDIGFIAVAPSDPNVLYVGTGEPGVRIETMASGDGLYKSRDAGKTWTKIGLEKSNNIASIVVDPRNPDIVYVGVQGTPWADQEGRGVYKSTDGGTTWAAILPGNARTGATSISMDPKNSQVLYATLWEHRQLPWHGYQITSGGPGSAVYKSTDAGAHWNKLTNGLPARIGKAEIAVSGADHNRVYALVEAKPGEGGLFASSDAGASWKLVNASHLMTQRTGYYETLYADPKAVDTIYIPNTPLVKSTDGGKTFKQLHSPHGDNHALWLNPNDPQWLIVGDDGGAQVSMNGGLTWSSLLNQPTQQFYRVDIDNLSPYNLYGGQQDNATVKAANRTASGGIGIRDWHDVGHAEGAHVSFDPDKPDLVYATNYQGQISQYNEKTGVLRNVQRYPLPTAYRPGEFYHYRYNWNAPVETSRFDRNTLYHGSQFLMKSNDQGQHWVEISPDLTRNNPKRHGYVAGEFTTDGVAGSMYNTIYYIAESPHHQGELWVGTDDGKVWLTRDEGKHWTDITPKGDRETLINAIELSAFQDGRAWVVQNGQRFGDNQPHILATQDYGKTWTQKNEGIDADDFARVVREDPARKGLLYAGTEHGIYLSFDDGDHWKHMQLNLPHVPVNDLQIHDGDLVAATQGRGFWVLDDIAPLRSLDKVAAGEAVLYSPTTHPELRSGRPLTSLGEPEGTNPPAGSLIYYTLPPGVQPDEVKLEILDASGNVLNSFSHKDEDTKQEKRRRGGPDADNLPTQPGLNRFVWNWEVRGATRYPEIASWHRSRSYHVAPGRYQARLSVKGAAQTQAFEVAPDPRSRSSTEAQANKQALLAAIVAESDAMGDEIGALKALHSDLEATLSDPAVGKGTKPAKALRVRVEAWLNETIEANNTHFVDFEHSPLRLDLNMLSLLGPVDDMEPPLTDGLLHRVSDVRGEFAKYQQEYAAIMAEAPKVQAAVGHWVVSPTRDVRPDDVGQPDNNGADGLDLEEEED